jgi:hypothetical protein
VFDEFRLAGSVPAVAGLTAGCVSLQEEIAKAIPKRM